MNAVWVQAKMKQTPLISIVIPTYNHARFLGRAVKSVVDQTYTNWEVVVVDNHSTDNTSEVMEGFSDPRITYLKINNNVVGLNTFFFSTRVHLSFQ